MEIPVSIFCQMGSGWSFYRLARGHWGKGLATEVGRRWIEVAPEFIDEPVLHAFAHADNATSLHVIRKLGFEDSHQEMVYGWEVPMHVLRVDGSWPDGRREKGVWQCLQRIFECPGVKAGRLALQPPW